MISIDIIEYKGETNAAHRYYSTGEPINYYRTYDESAVAPTNKQYFG